MNTTFFTPLSWWQSSRVQGSSFARQSLWFQAGSPGHPGPLRPAREGPQTGRAQSQGELVQVEMEHDEIDHMFMFFSYFGFSYLCISSRIDKEVKIYKGSYIYIYILYLCTYVYIYMAITHHTMVLIIEEEIKHLCEVEHHFYWLKPEV